MLPHFNILDRSIIGFELNIKTHDRSRGRTDNVREYTNHLRALQRQSIHTGKAPVFLQEDLRARRQQSLFCL